MNATQYTTPVCLVVERGSVNLTGDNDNDTMHVQGSKAEGEDANPNLEI